MQDCERFEKQHAKVLENLRTAAKPELLWVASGKNNVLYECCQDTLRLFDKCRIPYVYVEGKGLHGWETAANNLFAFLPLLFRDTP